MDEKDTPWIIARRGIKLLLNDKNKEAEILFVTSPPGIQITAGQCYVTFMNALMCFDDIKVTDAITKIKKIEEECVHQIGWVRSFRNKIFTGQEESKSLEQSLEEKIVLADSLVCQSFLTFLHNDFASYMKGGWTLRRAWKVYQHTHEQLTAIHKQIFGNCKISGWSSGIINTSSTDTSTSNISSPTHETNDDQRLLIDKGECISISSAKEANSRYSEIDAEKNQVSTSGADQSKKFYSCSSKTFSDFSVISNGQKPDPNDDNDAFGCELNESQSESSSVLPQSDSKVRPDCLRLRLDRPNGHVAQPLSCDSYPSSMRKSVSLFSSLNNFRSAILESASSLIGLNKESYKEWEKIEPETVLRLMSAVSFGYGVFRLCVSLAPPGILRWANMLGFEGDQSAAIESLHYSRKGSDMRAPLASLALLWYHTIVQPFFNLNGSTNCSGIEEASKILDEEKEYENSALFLFFKGRVERLKPNISGAIEAYQMSVRKATLPEVKLLGLHEVGWCHLLTLDYKQAHKCFLRLKQQSKWSKSFYAYLTTICIGATGNTNFVLPGRAEIKYFLDKSPNKGSQIERYIRRRMEKLPEAKECDKEWVKDAIHWQLYCFEMLYLWNTFSSCKSSDLEEVVSICTPQNGEMTLSHEPILGIGWLIKGSASLILANRVHQDNNDSNLKLPENSTMHLTNAMEAFRTCLQVRSKCSDDAHVSAFAQYELALLLLRNETTRPEGKVLLIKIQSQYKDYDFEHRLNVRVNATLKSVEKYESQNRSK